MPGCSRNQESRQTSALWQQRLPFFEEVACVNAKPSISTAAVEDAAALAPSAPAPDDPLISIMFSLAVVALTVLTLGVGYLSLTSWLDSRQEEEDRRKSGFAPKKVDANQGLSAFDTSSVDKKSKKKKSGAPKKASGKGFGS